MEVVVLVPSAPFLSRVSWFSTVVLQQSQAVLRVLATLLKQRGEVQVAAALSLFQFRWLPRRALNILEVVGSAEVLRLGLALLPLRDYIVLGGLPELDAEDSLGAGSIRGHPAHLGTVGVK